MNRIRTLCLLFAFLLSAYDLHGAETPSPAAAPKRSPYTLTVIPFYSPEKLWALYSPLVAYLKQATGQPWELKLYSDHDSLIEGLCSGEVSVALLGPVPLGRVNQKCGAKPLLVALGKDGKPAYQSVIVTSDPSVTDLAMLRGKKFALFKGSTAAHIVPLKMLKEAGLGTGSLQQVFFDGQDRIMTALLTREADAAGMKEALFRKFEKEAIRPLKKSDPLPNFAFCASPAVKPEVVKRFTEHLLALKPLSDPAAARIVKDWDDEIKNGYIFPDPEFLPSVLRLFNVYQEMTREAR